MTMELNFEERKENRYRLDDVGKKYLEYALSAEMEYLENDREKYLDFMSGKTMKSRVNESPDENMWNYFGNTVRNGLILFGLYDRVIGRDNVNRPLKRKTIG